MAENAERPTVGGPGHVTCFCGREHMIRAYVFPDMEPVIECPAGEVGKMYRLDTRYAMLDGARAFTGYDGPIWVHGPPVVGQAPPDAADPSTQDASNHK